MEKYFIIHNGEGETSVEEFTKEQLLENINEGYWGHDVDFLTEIPDQSDTNYWGGDLLCIKGSIVAPTPVQTVTEYDIS